MCRVGQIIEEAATGEGSAVASTAQQRTQTIYPAQNGRVSTVGPAQQNTDGDLKAAPVDSSLQLAYLGKRRRCRRPDAEGGGGLGLLSGGAWLQLLCLPLLVLSFSDGSRVSQICFGRRVRFTRRHGWQQEEDHRGRHNRLIEPQTKREVDASGRGSRAVTKTASRLTAGADTLN